MRGALTLFSDIFCETTTPAEGGLLRQRKGRSSELDAQRNECLVARYYYTGRENPKWSYQSLLKEVASHFFISTYTLHDVLQDNYGQLIGLKKENPNKAYFAKKWPHLVW